MYKSQLKDMGITDGIDLADNIITLLSQAEYSLSDTRRLFSYILDDIEGNNIVANFKTKV